MDLIAALGLVLLIEGLVLFVFARSLPELMAAMQEMDPGGLRRTGAVMATLGAICYVLVRQI